MERRTFLTRIVQIFSAAIAGLISLPAFRFLSSDSFSEQSAWTSILKLNENVLSEDVTQLTYTKVLRDGWMTNVVQDTVFVRKRSDGTFLVMDPHCTHLGCNVSWNADAKRFDCPCHGGKYDAEGRRIAGPPPRPLDRYETKVEGNELKIRDLKKV